ncbi:hypothetical protein [Faecalibacter bovis]|uniref:Lipoprotein n=1 Tax=Faecalibacter bovis TaxID=2898187 RepID=A0ABX7XA49_9FLAO|nr:hypothetical protein [Faecalibacter bovis]QTV04763.1 hypothetical protein J9309_08075 [Faecalibacter bovis]
MKKIFLTATILGVVALTSCKSEKEKVVDNVNDTQTAIQETANDAVVAAQETTAAVASALPTFTSPEAAAYAQKFSDYVGELKAVAATGDQAKLTELTGKAVDFQKELQGITQKLTAEDAKKLQDFVSELQKSVQ